MFDARIGSWMPVAARPPQREASGPGDPTRRRRSALQLASLLVGILSLLLLGASVVFAVGVLALVLHDDLPQETIEAAQTIWSAVEVMAVSSMVAGAGAVGLGIWGEVRRRRRGARGRWVGIVLGCGTLAAWAWLAMR